MDARHRRMHRHLVCRGRQRSDGDDTPMVDQENSDQRSLLTIFGSVALILLAAFLFLLFSLGCLHAHDADHPEYDEWYKTLMQPDRPNVPCCGVGDAYFADVARVRDGKLYAVVTDDRPDEPLDNRHHVPVGTEIEVPNEKLKWDRGNPTGHVVIFLNVNNVALCYVQGSGI